MIDDHNERNTAVFLNLASIQEYVFSTNKLKHVIGASYIVNTIYDDFPGEDLNELNPGYKGGGNKLAIFNSKDTAEIAVKKFTKHTLEKFPGIVFKIGFLDNFKVEGGESHDSVKEEDKDKSSDYQKSFSRIVKNAGVLLSANYPLTNLPKHGITADCPYSDLSADVVTDEYGKKQYISQSVAAKLDEKLWKHIREDDQKLLDEAGLTGYCFAREFENMGQQKDVDSHIAIVHIDGNGIGKEFRNCKNLNQMIALSCVADAVIRETFVKLLKDFKDIVTKLDLMSKIEKEKIGNVKKSVLPIRPIVVGGDDITIVCNSFLGIWVAQKFMDHFSEVSKEKLGESFTSCAGVCITKTKYPFYRGYKLAEELCHSAKTAYYKKAKTGNWIDFHVAMTDIPDKLSSIRDTQYKNAEGSSLTMRPYRTDVFAQRHSQALELKKLPNDWIKSLRSSLYAGENACTHWKQKAVWREKKFPVVPGFENIMNEKVTPYYDIIELSEIVLPELYETQKSE